MANYQKYNLTGKTPGTTYENIVQYNVESASLVAGDGYDLPLIIVSGSISVNQPSASTYVAYAIDVFDSIGMSTFGNKNYIQLDDGNGNMFINAGRGGHTYIALNPYVSSSGFGHDTIPTSPNSIAIGNGQNVGLNNLNPSYSLDISGTINFTGDLLQNGLPYTSSLSGSLFGTASYAHSLIPSAGLTTVVHISGSLTGTGSVTTMSFVNGLLQFVS